MRKTTFHDNYGQSSQNQLDFQASFAKKKHQFIVPQKKLVYDYNFFVTFPSKPRKFNI